MIAAFLPLLAGVHTPTHLLSVTSGGSYCQVTDGGSCVTDGSGNYGSDEACVISVLGDAILSSRSFGTEDCYDYLDVFAPGASTRSARFCGTTGPSSYAMVAGSTMRWSSDESVNDVGYLPTSAAGRAGQ